MAYLTDEDYENSALNLRVKLEMDHQIKLDVIELIRKLKHSNYITDYIVVPDPEMPDTKGKYVPEERKIYFRQSVWKGAQRNDPHSRWTVGHEASHFALGHQKTRYRNLVASKIEKIAPTIRKDESEADRLTAALLAPFHRSDYSPQTTPQQLASRFCISLPAAIIRVGELARIFRRTHGISRSLPKGVLDFLSEQKKRGFKVTSVDVEPSAAQHPRYEGDACPNCMEFLLVRNGLHMKCENCGTCTGDD